CSSCPVCTCKIWTTESSTYASNRPSGDKTGSPPALPRRKKFFCCPDGICHTTQTLWESRQSSPAVTTDFPLNEIEMLYQRTCRNSPGEPIGSGRSRDGPKREVSLPLAASHTMKRPS